MNLIKIKSKNTHGHILMNLIKITQYQVHITLMTFQGHGFKCQEHAMTAIEIL